MAGIVDGRVGVRVQLLAEIEGGYSFEGMVRLADVLEQFASELRGSEFPVAGGLSGDGFEATYSVTDLGDPVGGG